jgi:hypothetical protein
VINLLLTNRVRQVETWHSWQGDPDEYRESPCRVRANHPLLSSVASGAEVFIALSCEKRDTEQNPGEAYTENYVGHRGCRTFLKLDIAPTT